MLAEQNELWCAMLFSQISQTGYQEHGLPSFKITTEDFRHIALAITVWVYVEEKI